MMANQSSTDSKLGYTKIEKSVAENQPTLMVTFFHEKGNSATKRLSDFLPSIETWLASGWDGPYLRYPIRRSTR